MRTTQEHSPIDRLGNTVINPKKIVGRLDNFLRKTREGILTAADGRPAFPDARPPLPECWTRRTMSSTGDKKTRLFRIRKTIGKMLNARGYMVGQAEEAAKLLEGSSIQKPTESLCLTKGDAAEVSLMDV